MKREIRFRVWDTKNKIMVTDKNWEQYKNNSTLGYEYCKDEWYPVYQVLEMIFPVISDQFEKMQFTGLKDKNGNEIYEGDVLSINDFSCPVTFSDGCFQLKSSPNQGTSPLTGERASRLKVIGNIYQHPELLNQEK
jgi:hypothetical protein